MKRGEYLSDAFNKYNEGKISAEVYDAIIMNINEFCEDEENEEDETEENKMNNNLYVYDEQIYSVIDETKTHYVCAPKYNEGYGYIPKNKSITLIEKEKMFNLDNRTLDECRKYNLWIMRQGFSDYAIHTCQECGKNFFRRDKAECICDKCEDKDNFRILIHFCDGKFYTRIYKNYIDAYNDMEKEISIEAEQISDKYEDINIKEGYDDGTVTCLKDCGFVSGNTSQEDVYWKIVTFNINQF